MQADDAVLQGMAEAERGKAERAQEHGTAEKATYEGVSAAHLPDNEKQTGRVTFGALPTAEEAGAPEGATIVDGERGQHLTGDKLTSHFTLKDFVFGNVNELRYIELPSEEEKRTLRRVPDHIVLATYLIGLLELIERFSYYGCTVVFTNFIQQPRPPGSRTGAGRGEQSGALDQGQRAAFGLTTFNTFWVYVTPIAGAYLADVYLGRFNTIALAIAFAFAGHLLFVGSASMIDNPSGALGLLAVGMVISGLGTGAFKSNISPLIAEQNRCNVLRIKVLKGGERVIVDPTLTASRVFMYFYLLVNLGALAGQLGMAYAERNIGFWLAYTLPTILLALAPLILIFGKRLYVLRPPQGSVAVQAFRLLALAWKGRVSPNPIKTFRNVQAADFWERVKPSNIAPSARPTWMTFDDVWVSEVRRGFKSCQVFILIPLLNPGNRWWLCYSQNLNPIALVVSIPLMDLIVYPFLRRKGIRFTQLRRITLGFFIGSAAMIWATVVQTYIYKRSACGRYASECDTVAPINVWTQTGSYVLIAWSEIFVSITGLEVAYTKAPRNMRSLVTSMFLLTNAFASAIGTHDPRSLLEALVDQRAAQAFVSVSADPLLEWNYGVFAVLSAMGGCLFWFFFRNLDKEEEKLNELGEGGFVDPKHARSTDRLLPEAEAGRRSSDVDNGRHSTEVEHEKQKPKEL